MELKSNDTTIDIPLFVSEIPLKRYISFKRARGRWHEVLNKDRFEGNDIGLLHEGLLDVLPTLVDGDISELPFYEEAVDDNFMIDMGFKGVLSLWHIYCHLLNIIDSYEPTETLDYSFEWFDIIKGKSVPTTYYIEPDRAKRLLTKKNYTSGEYIELKEYERKVSRKIVANAKKKGYEGEEEEQLLMTGDANGNLAFTLSKRKLCILARPKGEKLPSNKSEREELIERRRKVFDEISLDIYLNVRFFLLGIVIGLSPEEITNPSTNPSKNHFTVVRKKRNRTSRQKKSRKRKG